MGKKFAKVEYTYTLKDTGVGPNKDKVPVIIKQNPNDTIWYTDFFTHTRINMKVKFYDESGNLINAKDGLLSFSSLNRGEIGSYTDTWEKVSSFNGEILEISGSSVKNHSDGAYANGNNENISKGSKFDRNSWDESSSKNQWYGAAVGKIAGTEVSFDISSKERGNIWFALNSDIKALGVPVKPVEPTPPTPPVEPKKPDVQATYHYDILHVKSQVEKKVTDETGKDINNKAVQTGSVVKFKLETSNFPAGHEKINSLVFNDTLPEGYELNLNDTKQASPDYDVAYDKDSRLLVFKAKDTLLNQINKDLTKEAAVPSPIIIGKVTKEGTRYENHFDLDINNAYKVKSTPVKVTTPIKPKKDVVNESGTTINGKVVKPGEVLTYVVDYTNTTDQDRDVTIKDKIPEYTTYVENSADNNGKFANGELTWTKKVEKGKSWKVTFKVRVNDDANGVEVKNKARVADGILDIDTNPTNNPTPKKPIKDVVNESGTTINGKVVKPREILTYTVDYTNTTDQDRDVTIKDKIPAYTTYVENSADNNGKFANGELTWIKKVEKGKSWKVTFKVKVNDDAEGIEIKNKARVADGVIDVDTNPTNNPTPKKPKKDVVNDAGTTINGKVVKPGEILTYTVDYTNTTDQDRDVTIKDKIPAYTTYVENSADNNGKFADGQVTWTKRVAKGQSLKVTFKVKVNDDTDGNVIKNIARVADGVIDIDTNPTNNPTPKKPKKDVVDNGGTSIDGKVVKPGEVLTYVVDYTNTTGEDR
uniref:GbpC/Spa domain-containing protein n=1 Tax=Gemella cuniculi TaxID=150240 RepID=UPI0012EC5D28